MFYEENLSYLERELKAWMDEHDGPGVYERTIEFSPAVVLLMKQIARETPWELGTTCELEAQRHS